MTDKIKEAAQFLRNTLKSEAGEVRSSHAHQTVAAYLGFSSKKALIDSGLDTSSDELFTEFEPNLEKISEATERMRDSHLKAVPVPLIADIIEVGLSPDCEFCGKKLPNIQPITSPDDFDSPDGWVCDRCFREEDEYATCFYCGPEIIYRVDQINAQGECPEHDGESEMSEEEEQGWNDYIENLNKDL